MNIFSGGPMSYSNVFVCLFGFFYGDFVVSGKSIVIPVMFFKTIFSNCGDLEINILGISLLPKTVCYLYVLLFICVGSSCLIDVFLPLHSFDSMNDSFQSNVLLIL